MQYFKKFVHDTSGGVIEKVSLMAFAITLASLGGAHVINVAIRDGGLPTIAARHGDSDLARIAQNLPHASSKPGAPAGVGVDYSSTASIPDKAGHTRLDPCTGAAK